MAAQWHYSKGGERHGPVSSDQLRQLAASGQLGPTDLVWRDGMADWQKASAVKGLFPSQTSVPTAPPPIPQKESQHKADPAAATAEPAAGRSEKHGLLGTLSSLGHAAKTAAVVAAKEAERTKINNVDLPKAYAALGRDVHGRGAYREGFADLYRQIDDLLARLRKLEGDPPKQSNSPATFADKAKAAAVATKQKAEAQAMRLQLSRLMSKLGEAVYERHGSAAGSPEKTAPIASLLSRASMLANEVEQQRQASGGRVITRRRVVVAVVVTAIGIALLLPAIESAREASRKDKTATSGNETTTDSNSDAEASTNAALPPKRARDHSLLPWMSATVPKRLLDESAELILVEGQEECNFKGTVPNTAVWQLRLAASGKEIIGVFNNSEYGDEHVTAILFDLKGRELKRAEYRVAGNPLSLSPSGRLLAIYMSGNPSHVTVIDGLSGRKVSSMTTDTEPQFLAYSLDESVAICGGYGTAILFNPQNGSILKRLRLPETSGPHGVAAFGPDGKTLLTAHGNGVTILWETETGREIWRTSPPGDNEPPESLAVCSLAVSPEGQTAVSGHYDGAAKLWDLNTGRLRGVFDGHRSSERISGAAFLPVSGAAFLPDGKIVASTAGEAGKTTFLWRLSDLDILARLDNCGPLIASISGDRAIFGDGVWRLPQLIPASEVPPAPCNPPTPAEGIVTLSTPAFQVEAVGYGNFGFSSDGALLGVIRDGKPVIFDLVRRKQVAPIITSGDIDALSLSQGSLLGGRELDIPAALAFRAFAYRHPEAARKTRKLMDYLNSNRLSPNSDLLAIGDVRVQRFTVHDTLTGAVVVRLGEVSPFGVERNQVAFSCDSKWVAFTSDDEGAVWSTQSGNRVLSFGGPKPIHVLGFSPNSETFAAIAGREMTLWSTGDWKAIAVFTSDGTTREFGGFSPDGNRFVSMEPGLRGKCLVVWDVQKKGELRRIETADTVSVEFIGPDHLVSRELNRERAIFWRIEDGSRAAEVDFGIVGSGVKRMRVSASGRFVASCHLDSTVYVWDMCDGKLLPQQTGEALTQAVGPQQAEDTGNRTEDEEWVEIDGNLISASSLPPHLRRKAPPVSKSLYEQLRRGMQPQDVWKLFGGRPAKEGFDSFREGKVIGGVYFEGIAMRASKFEFYLGNGGPGSGVLLFYDGDKLPPPLVDAHQVNLK